MIANLEPEPTGSWLFTVHVVRRGAPVASGSARFSGGAWVPRGNTNPGPPASWDPLIGSIRMTADGWTAIEIEAPIRGVVVMNLLSGHPDPKLIDGHSPVWLPDGTLLLGTRILNRETVRRVTDHGSGQILDTVVSGMWPAYPLNYIVHEDLTGIDGSAGDGPNWTRVTLTWGGDVEQRDVKESSYLALGSERLSGSKGQRIEGCNGWGPCELAWRRPNGRVLTHPSIDIEHAWTRDGTAVVVLDGAEPNDQSDDRVLLLRDSAKGLVTQPLAKLPAGELEGGLFFFRGMSDWAAALERDMDMHVNVIPLDGSPVIGPFHGTVALVNP